MISDITKTSASLMRSEPGEYINSGWVVIRETTISMAVQNSAM